MYFVNCQTSVDPQLSSLVFSNALRFYCWEMCYFMTVQDLCHVVEVSIYVRFPDSLLDSAWNIAI